MVVIFDNTKAAVVYHAHKSFLHEKHDERLHGGICIDVLFANAFLYVCMYVCIYV
jgi:hypothetical protein